MSWPEDFLYFLSEFVLSAVENLDKIVVHVLDQNEVVHSLTQDVAKISQWIVLPAEKKGGLHSQEHCNDDVFHILIKKGNRILDERLVGSHTNDPCDEPAPYDVQGCEWDGNDGDDFHCNRKSKLGYIFLMTTE